MEPWQAWREMAEESEKIARLAEAERGLRSAASRCCYAAYQGDTAGRLYRGLTPPSKWIQLVPAGLPQGVW